MSSAGGSQKKKKAAGTEGVSGNAGIVPTERYGGGQRRRHGGVELCSKCGERYGWLQVLWFAAILVEDDGRPHTTDLFKNCYNLRLAERNEPEVAHSRWRTLRRQEDAGKILDGRGGDCDAAGEKLARELHYREELELLRESDCVRLEGTMIRQAMKAGKAGDWSELLKSELNARTRAKIQECYYEVKQEDERRSIEQQIL